MHTIDLEHFGMQPKKPKIKLSNVLKSYKEGKVSVEIVQK
jgi:hypothetical protein